MSNNDFRDQEPVWVRYAELVNVDHNKYYEVRVDMDDDGLFVLSKRWGPRPDVGRGQIKIERYQTLNAATGEALTMLAAKVRKGYCEAPRPKGASNKVFHEQGADYYGDEDAEAF